jgi:hypothetical protein
LLCSLTICFSLCSSDQLAPLTRLVVAVALC